jgi:uncharacterized protein (DUF1684 family)
MRGLTLALALIVGAADAPASYRAEIEKYRKDRVAELTAPNGWLAVQGLFWLHEGGNPAGSDPSAEIKLPSRTPKRIGVFSLQSGAVSFTADPAAGVTAAGKPVDTFTFDPRKGEESSITVSGVTLFVIRRADKIGLRMLDPESDARKAAKHEDLFFIFKDLTSRQETYGAGRFLHAPVPKDGLVDLDFNRAYNPPCAFTDFATCPLPVKENQLPVRIPAGEMRWDHPGHKAPTAGSR